MLVDMKWSSYLSEQNSSLVSFSKFAAGRPQLSLESRRLLRLPLPLVEHLRQGLQGRQGELQGHPVVVARGRLLHIDRPSKSLSFWEVCPLLGLYLEKVLEQEDELGEPLNGFDHQSKEVETVGSGDLLHLQKVGKSGLSLGFRLGQLHRLVEVVDEVRVDLQHRGLGEGCHKNVPNSFLLKIWSFIDEHLLSCLYLDTLKLLGVSDMIQELIYTDKMRIKLYL